MKKLTGFVLAAAFAVTATTTVSAQTVSDLQAQIDALLAQLALVSTTTASTSAGYNFVSDLTIGSTGPAVVELQTALELKGALVMPVGVSKGYFGALTQSALARYQASVGISPAVGYFGPITRAHFNSMVGSTTTTTTTTTTTDTTTTTGLSGGEASLEDFDLSSEDDAEEGEMTHVATATFEVEDGDVQINRVDITFTPTDTPTEDDPWDAFDTITLMIDGEEVAEEDVDDEDDWLDDNGPDYVFRLSGIDYVAEDGDEVEIEIYLTAQSSVDGSGTDASWTISIEDEAGIRAVDGEGIQNYIGGTDTVTFDIDEEGGDEDIQIKSSSNDPESATLLVDDNDDSEWHEVFIFNLEAEESDIELDQLVINVAVDDDSDGTTTYAEIVNDIIIEIDGQEFDDFTVANAATTTNTNVTFDIDGDFTIDADDTVEVVVMIEFNKFTGNYTDGGDTSVIVSTVSVDGEGADDVTDAVVVTGEEHVLNSAVAAISGVTSEVATDDPNDSGVISFEFTVDAEEDDVTFAVADNADVTGSDEAAVAQVNEVTVGAVANATLYTVTLNGTDFDYTSDASATEAEIIDGLAAAINAGAEPVTATDDDVTLTLTADTAGTAFTIAVTANLAQTETVANSAFDGTDAVKFDLTGTDTSIASAQLTKVSGDATYAAGVWTINEGDDATFVLDVSFTTVDANDNGVYRVRLDSVAGSSVDKTSNGLNLSF